MCLFLSLTPPNGEPQRAEILKDDSPWDGEGFRLKNMRIRRTVSRKISLSKHQSVSELICLSVYLFGCSLTLPKRRNPASRILRDDSPWDWEGFRLKNNRIRLTVALVGK